MCSQTAASRFTTSTTATAIVGQVTLPNLADPRTRCRPATNTLYVAYGGSGGSSGAGSMLAYNLVTGKTLWRHTYETGVDNIAITPNGRTIYMAVGESSNSSTWEIIDPSNGKVIGSIEGGSGPHETIMGPDGKYVYLGGVNTPYLYVASTSTNRVVRKIGPLHGPGVTTVHDQRGADVRLHDLVELPRVPGQQHQDRKGVVQRRPRQVFGSTRRRSAASPTTASPSPPTDASST